MKRNENKTNQKEKKRTKKERKEIAISITGTAIYTFVRK